jgi:hypothetical protein
MPVFEGLFQCVPALESLVQDLLYMLATWHAYAKARLHTQTLLNALGSATTTLGHLLCVFRCETDKIDTKETPKEKAAQLRREAKQAERNLKSGKPSKGKRPAGPIGDDKHTEGHTKRFNMFTYKMHALGSYVRAIMTFGTSDNFSTQLVSHLCYFVPVLTFLPQGELAHRAVKLFYARTNRSTTFTEQISVHEHRTRTLHAIDERLQAVSEPAAASPDLTSDQVRTQAEAAISPKRPAKRTAKEKLPRTDPAARYAMSDERRYPIPLRRWLDKRRDDPALIVSYVTTGKTRSTTRCRPLPPIQLEVDNRLVDLSFPAVCIILQQTHA